MKKLLLAAAVAALAAACQPASAPSSSTATTTETATGTTETSRDLTSSVAADAPYITAALASTRRPAADRAQDATRHPAETLALSGVAPGQKIGELMAGEGYFTRLFSLAVGHQGHVYTIVRLHPSQYEHPVAEDMGNVTTVHGDYDAFTLPAPVDLVFTARNYHDLKIASYNMGDTVGMERAAFAALRPGGLYVVIDHSAVAGSATDQAHPLHRIDQDVVRREVESVGFIYDGDSQMLRNPQDPRTANVFDPVIRGHTDQFFMRFHKPN
jgi:predicted methyltransferase